MATGALGVWAADPVSSTVDAAANIPASVRLMDTRDGYATVDGQFQETGAFDANTTRTVRIAGRGGIAPKASSVALNVTVTNAAAQGYVTVYRCAGSRPNVSTVNFEPGQEGANLAIVTLTGQGDVCVFSSVPTDVILDAVAVLSAEDFSAYEPGRLIDSRPGMATTDGRLAGGGRLGARSTTRVAVAGRAGVPASASSVVVNLTATDPQSAGYLTVYGCDFGIPATSNLNFAKGAIVANLAFVQLGASGDLCIYANQPTHAIVDLVGSLRPSAFTAINPARIADTRPGGTTVDGAALGDGLRSAETTAALHVAGRGGVPADASAVILNMTATNSRAVGHAVVYPAGSTRPATSNVNYSQGRDAANTVIARVGVGGQVCVFNSEATDLVVDVVGWLPGPAQPTTGAPCSPTTPPPTTVPPTTVPPTTVPPTTVPPTTVPPTSGMSLMIPGIVNRRGPGRSSNEVLRRQDGFTGTPNGLGDVRITCGVSHHAYDDPIVSPGRPGVSHMHTFFGNAGADANSTFASLRAEPKGSTCAGGAVNKSSYWFPSLIDGSSNTIVDPTLTFVYYKTGYWGQDGRNIVPMPDGLRMVSGDAMAPRPQESWHAYWSCSTHDGSGVPTQLIRSGSSIVSCGQGQLLEAHVMFPQCWNGRDLDSADHKSHMSHPNFQGQCPASHPVMIPQITVQATWNMGAAGSSSLYLASDMMLPAGAPKGQGLHADFFEAWDPASKQAFVTNCLNGRRDCGVRSLGDGYALLDVR